MRWASSTRGPAPKSASGSVPFDHRGGQPAAARRARRGRRIHLDLEHVARVRDARAGRRAGEDDISRLQRDQLAEVGDQSREREQQFRRWCPPARARRCARCGCARPAGSIERASISSRPDRRESVCTLRPQVGPGVGVPQVVDAQIVGGRDSRDVRPGILDRDAPRRGADDQRDLALEPQELGARRALDDRSRGGVRRRRLEEVGGLGRHPAALRRRDSGSSGGVR